MWNPEQYKNLHITLRREITGKRLTIRPRMKRMGDLQTWYNNNMMKAQLFEAAQDRHQVSRSYDPTSNRTWYYKEKISISCVHLFFIIYLNKQERQNVTVDRGGSWFWKLWTPALNNSHYKIFRYYSVIN